MRSRPGGGLKLDLTASRLEEGTKNRRPLPGSSTQTASTGGAPSIQMQLSLEKSREGGDWVLREGSVVSLGLR